MRVSPQSFYNWYNSLLVNPKYRWWIILGSLLYFLSPIDISPDLVPFIGQIDDAIVLGLLFTGLTQLVTNFVQSRGGNVEGSGTTREKNVTKDAEVKTIDVDSVSLD
ncbi:MAG: YkvA family protein [Prochloraceae cyanobacterium]|nr:YkvA family protein [Prochloraceae cyanobacterium]